MQDLELIKAPIGQGNLKAVDLLACLGDRGRNLPLSLRVLAENTLRQPCGRDAVINVVARNGKDVPFRPSRLILQDMLGLPALIDLMALRSRMNRSGQDPARIDATLPVDLIIDHSLTLDHWAEKFALQKNQRREFELNRERFSFIKACESMFRNLRVIPPGGGIMHQINLEFLSHVVLRSGDDHELLVPDTNLGTDSHTTMVNGLGVLGWGIGGLEAEAIMLGETTSVNVPKVVGLEIAGSLDARLTATDVALSIAEKLRALGVVDCFVELFGQGYANLSVADRSTIANMSPEYGSTAVFCPCDANTLRYLRGTGRPPHHVKRAEAYCRFQGLWAGLDNSRIDYDQVVHMNLGKIRPSVSGPSRPEQRLDLESVPSKLASSSERQQARRFQIGGKSYSVGDGDVIISAITSCTNTANPRNMILAGLIARNAVSRGLESKPYVKTSLAPGSRVVADYLSKSGLQDALDELGFQVAAFSCSTCNGMSGPLAPEIETAVRDNGVKGVAVLSGNRNFAGRIHPLASRNMLASPPLVVAYALLGTILKDITSEPLGIDRLGQPVFLSDLWPDEDEVEEIMLKCITPENFIARYSAISTVNSDWNSLDVRAEEFAWKPSTYVTFPPYIESIAERPPMRRPLIRLRPLAILGDSITTDHISPSGAIQQGSAAGDYLELKGVKQREFNSYGTRRGCSDVVARSTFANLRLRNEMTPDREGSWTRLEPDGQIVTMFQAIETYRKRNQRLVIIAGRNYGCGSSRDTAAKAPWLAGVRAVLAESFERIHRSNLVNMGIAPIEFPAGINRKTLNMNGSEQIDIEFPENLTSAKISVAHGNGSTQQFVGDLRIYNRRERENYRHGGLLPNAFRRMIAGEAG